MVELSRIIPDEFPQERAEEVSGWILEELDSRGETPIYTNRLGYMTMVFEVYYINRTGEPYIDVELTNNRKSHQLETIRKGLSNIVDSQPSRRAYKNGKKWGHKVYGFKSQPPKEDMKKELVKKVVEDCKSLETTEIKNYFIEKQMPWDNS